MKWVKSKSWCISTPSFSFLVNGTPTDFCKSSSGLRQRNPLSPYLFILRMKDLFILPDKVVSRGYILRHTFEGKNSSEEVISHLHLANNNLIFCKDFVDQISFLTCTLAQFEAPPCMTINMLKSAPIPLGNVVAFGVQLALELGCHLDLLPID